VARPIKQTVDYFPHDANANESMTLTIIQERFGINGYAFWFKLLEMLCQTEGHCLDLSDEMKLEFLSAKSRIPTAETLEVLHLLAKLGAIDTELWTNNRKIWVQKLVDRVKDAYRRRVDKLPKRPVITAGNGVSTGGNLVITGFLPAETGKEKGKGKGKLKEIYKEKVLLTIEEFENLQNIYGKEFTEECITVLNNYKLSSGKTYKSDYHAILTWVVNRVNKDKGGNTTRSHYSKNNEKTLFALKSVFDEENKKESEVMINDRQKTLLRITGKTGSE
jgi:hypothetical protein